MCDIQKTFLHRRTLQTIIYEICALETIIPKDISADIASIIKMANRRLFLWEIEFGGILNI